MVRVALFILGLAVTIFAVADIALSKPERFPSGQFPGGIPKAFWLFISLLFFPVGAIAWLVISRVQLADESGVSLPQFFKRNSRPAAGPVAPDDDPEFLWKLEKEIYQQRKERQQDSSETPLSEGISESTGQVPGVAEQQGEEDQDAHDDSSDASR